MTKNPILDYEGLQHYHAKVKTEIKKQILQSSGSTSASGLITEIITSSIVWKRPENMVGSTVDVLIFGAGGGGGDGTGYGTNFGMSTQSVSCVAGGGGGGGGYGGRGGTLQFIEINALEVEVEEADMGQTVEAEMDLVIHGFLNLPMVGSPLEAEAEEVVGIRQMEVSLAA